MNQNEARVGDRITIHLLDIGDLVVKNKKVVVVFTNKQAPFEVGWARWRQGENGEVDYSALQVAVPQRVLPDAYKSEWVTVEVRVGDDVLTGRAGLHVFPRTRVVLETINDRSVSSELPAAIEWTHQIRVTGSGFVAPSRRIEFRVDGVLFPVQSVDPEGRSFVAQLADNPDCVIARLDHIGRKRLSLTVWDHPVDLGGFDTVQVEDATQLTSDRKWTALRVALIPLGLLVALLWWACRRLRFNRVYAERTQTQRVDSDGAAVAGSRPGSRPKQRSSLELLLLDPATNTYSLSRFQFLWWLAVVLFSYSYLFYARGRYVAGDWCFYDLSGSAYPLLISLGTLVAATWTTKIVGPKGAGDVHPSLTDLCVHGGVISLDRVQQLAISLIAGVMFLWIVWQKAPTTATLPDVPEKILTLMGFSSAGYLGGKFARRAGPIVSHVDIADVDRPGADESGKSEDATSGAKPAEKGKVLRIWGSNLSVGAQVFVNRKRVDPDAIVPGERSDRESGFTDVLRIAQQKLPSEIGVAELRSIVVVNSDSQEARWAAPDDQQVVQHQVE